MSLSTTIEAKTTPARAKRETTPPLIVNVLHRAEQEVSAMLAEKLDPLGITPRQLAIMASLAAEGAVSQKRLVDATGIDRSTMADVVRRMLKSGVITRRRSKEDARAYKVSLSETGKRTYEKATAGAADIEAMFPADLLSRVRNSCDQLAAHARLERQR